MNMQHSSTGSNPYLKYKQQTVMTMTQGEMLTQLYDGILKQLNAAAVAIESGDNTASNMAMQKAQAILVHLRQTLDHQYEVSASLDSLYEYFIYEIVQANIKKSNEKLWEIMGMVKELRETFIMADRSIRTQ